MKLAHLIALSTLAMCGLAAQAQPRHPGGPCVAASGASAPHAGCGGGPMGGMHGRHWDAGNTPGWAMMTPQEREAHRDRMSGFTSYEDCKAYLDQHRRLMADRAKERGSPLPPPPRRDACASLKPKAKP